MKKKLAAAVAMGKLGGTARAKRLSKKRRIEIAKLAVNTRWERQRELIHTPA